MVCGFVAKPVFIIFFFCCFLQTIQDAFDDFQKDRSRLEGYEKQDDMRCFYNTLPNVKHGTTSYIIKAVVKNLLDGDIKVSTDDMCAIS